MVSTFGRCPPTSFGDLLQLAVGHVRQWIHACCQAQYILERVGSCDVHEA